MSDTQTECERCLHKHVCEYAMSIFVSPRPNNLREECHFTPSEFIPTSLLDEALKSARAVKMFLADEMDGPAALEMCYQLGHEYIEWKEGKSDE